MPRAGPQTYNSIPGFHRGFRTHTSNWPSAAQGNSALQPRLPGLWPENATSPPWARLLKETGACMAASLSVFLACVSRGVKYRTGGFPLWPLSGPVFLKTDSLFTGCTQRGQVPKSYPKSYHSRGFLRWSLEGRSLGPVGRKSCLPSYEPRQLQTLHGDYRADAIIALKPGFLYRLYTATPALP